MLPEASRSFPELPEASRSFPKLPEAEYMNRRIQTHACVSHILQLGQVCITVTPKKKDVRDVELYLLVGLSRCPVRIITTNINNSIATNLTTLVIVVLLVSSNISNTISTKITSNLSSTTSSSLCIVSMRETFQRNVWLK